ncbi:class I SAM-dependent methyltransferase [Micromonospora sp. NBC_01796]|uniref:class I SAM-dependent methyltransferase n=1 Tax=Micromonospora sp. NBC_01796 TaxID=2975987 RepID=UPI002DD88ED3|nr:SAM-dependent methyltransferase [Micromonospora sp. NBC_01796]WSA89560.1 SAM-dependent methyltransferase [Micromonospora sp. NBC_01796]
MAVANEKLTFLTQFVRQPMAVGAIAPSSRALADKITAPVPRTGDPVVVELGPGTGSFTGEIQRRLGGRGHQLAIEINPDFAGALSRRYPAVDVISDDARKLRDLLAARGHRQADVIVSGLPWAAFNNDLQQNLLDAVADGLADDGAFTTFAYLFAIWTPPAQRLRTALRSRFEEVTMGRTVWANLPPALVYHCRRPIRTTRPHSGLAATNTGNTTT